MAPVTLGSDGLAVPEIFGPEIIQHRFAVQTLARGIHRLATNARKDGALSVPAGRLEVSWRATGRRDSDPDEPDGAGKRRSASFR